MSDELAKYGILLSFYSVTIHCILNNITYEYSFLITDDVAFPSSIIMPPHVYMPPSLFNFYLSFSLIKTNVILLK